MTQQSRQELPLSVMAITIRAMHKQSSDLHKPLYLRYFYHFAVD